MHLLTWHGTVICRPDASGPLRHEHIPLPPGATPLSLANFPLEPGTVADHPALGVVLVGQTDAERAISFSRAGFFMCAASASNRMLFDRLEVSGWEMFLPITPQELRDLRHILHQHWIVETTRELMHRSTVVLLQGLKLRVGRFAVDLASPLSWRVTARDADGRPLRLKLQQAALIAAEAHGSALVRPSPGGDAARQLAEAIAIALHRHIARREPEQAVFDAQAALIESQGIIAGLESVLDQLIPAGAPQETGDTPGETVRADRPSTVIAAANESLQRFRAEAGLQTPATFGLYNHTESGHTESGRTESGQDLHEQAFMVDMVANAVTIRVPDASPDPTLIRRTLPLMVLLDAMVASAAGGDAKFILEPGEAGRLASVAYCSAARAGCLVPDFDFLSTRGYRDLRSLTQIAWSERNAQVFWRGASTGMRRKPPPAAVPDDFTWLPRLDLCRRARDSAHAVQFDVGISEIAQIPEPDLVQRITESGLCKPPAPPGNLLNHKAAFVIDGNTSDGRTLFRALLSGACVLLVASPCSYRQWYHGHLEPFVHYLPVRQDLRDLDGVVKWVFDNDDDARAIAEAGKVMADSLTFETAVRDGARRLASWLAMARR